MPGLRRVILLGLALLLLPVAPALAVTVERVVSPLGIEAWLVRDHTNPIISMSFAFRGGAITDPPGKAGRAYMAGGLLDEGAGDMDSLAFQTRLEDLSVRLSFTAGRDDFSGSLKTLAENRKAAFDLLRLAVTQPRFDPEPVERIRSQILVGLAREMQDPDQVASRRWFAAQFPDHPYGTPPNGDPETIKAITVDDLRQFVAQRLARDNLVIGVVGDVTAEDLAGLLDSTFGNLPEKAAPVMVAETQPGAPGKVIVERRSIPQTVVVFGEGGIKRQDPEWYAAYVMNYILGGGGFSSRLMEEVRVKRGLAYSVYSYLQPFDYVGLIVGGVATENERVAQSLDLIRAEWRRMRDEGPSAEELDNAKTYLTGSFPLQLSSTGAIAGILVAMQLDDLGIDYLDRRNAYIEAVTLEDVKRVAGRLLDPERLTAVVVGDPKELAGAL